LPFLVYRGAIELAGKESPERTIESTFGANGWGDMWRNGIFPYVHYHSMIHEALGIARGRAKVRFGGEAGEVLVKWIVRGQKTGSGESTLYLYRLAPHGYVPASEKPLGDLAWAYLKTRPDWRKIAKEPEYHMSAYLLKGLEENYRWLGVDWPANRYILIALSGDADIKSRKPMQTSVVHGWRCRYDLQTGKFDAPALFSANNAKAVVPGWPGAF
jgi:hypothetical protein